MNDQARHREDIKDEDMSKMRREVATDKRSEVETRISIITGIFNVGVFLL